MIDAAAPGSTPWSYNATANIGFLGAGETITFAYTVTATDGSGATASDVVSFTITGTNEGPTVDASNPTGFFEALNASAQNLNQSGTVSFDDIGSNDVIDITFAPKDPPVWSHGSLDPALGALLLAGFSTGVIDAAAPGSTPWSYNATANLDFLAVGETITFSYTVTATDGSGATATDVVSFTITGTNDGPVAVADQAAGTEHQILTIDVLANDTDVDDGHVFTLNTVSAPAGKGTASVVGNQVQFNPGTAFDHLAVGVVEHVTLSYTMQDQFGATSASTVDVTITGTNDGPVAVADQAAGTENQTLTINVLANDTDVDDGHVFTLNTVIAPAGKGTASVVGNQVQFNPGTAFDHLAVGVVEHVTLSYTMQDQFGATSASTVDVTITGTNDGPVAVADQAAGTENQTLTINVLANDTDVDDGHVFTLNTVIAPAGKGTASVVGNQVQFNPGTAFDHLAVGVVEHVTLSYTMQDQFGATSASTVDVTITGTNDGPVAVADQAAGTENQTLTINVLANDTDVDDGHVFTLNTVIAPAGKGTASVVGNQVQFNPGTAFDHLAVGVVEHVTLSYTMQDQFGATSASTVDVTITGTNDGPVAVADQAAGTENQTLTIDVLANDTGVDDGHVFTLNTVIAPAGKGTASVVGNQVQFNPGTAFDHLAVGVVEHVTLSYTMQDQFGATSASTVDVTITGTNDGPVAVADQAAGTENQTLTINVLANDTDVDDGHVFTLNTVIAPAGKGTASVVGNQVQFNPGTAFDHLAVGVVEHVTLSYTMQDQFGATSASTVDVTITGTNDGPVAVADQAAGTENQTLTIDVLANDTDVDDGHVFTLNTVSRAGRQGHGERGGQPGAVQPGDGL